MSNSSSHGIPDAVDVAVIGGGIIGVCTAYVLAQQGVSVAVFEKGVLAGEQSSRNWGWVRTLNRDAAEIPLALRAQTLWGEIQSRIDVGFRRTGILYLQESDDDRARHARWIDIARPYGCDATLLTSHQVAKYLPPSPRPWCGALYSASDGVAEPGLATQGIAALAREHGARLYEHCAVRGLDVQAGKVAGVVTEHGRVRAQAAVLAGGAWSRLFCGNSGVEFPQLKVRGSVMRTHPFPASLDVAVNAGDFTCRKRADGGYTVSQFDASIADVVPDSFRLMGKFMRTWLANKTFVRLRLGRRFFEELAIARRFDLDSTTPFEQHRVLDPQPAAAAVRQAWKRLVATFPAFNETRIAQSWAGYIDVTPDALPVMSAVQQVPGFFLASGFSGHGFGIGPAAGEVMADLVLGREPRVDIEAFRFSRFDRQASATDRP